MMPVASIADQRSRARRRVPRVVFDFVDGGAEAETTVNANRAAFDAMTFRQPCAVAPPLRSLETVVLGTRLSMPVLIAPCGSARIVHPDGERALARAARDAGIAYVFPHVGGYPVDAIDAAPGAPWYQLYLMGERAWTEAALERAWAAGCRVLVVTADGGARGVNERNVRNGFGPLLSGAPLNAVPYVPQLLARPAWLLRFARDPGRFDLPNLAGPNLPPVTHRDVLAGRVAGPGVAWSDLRWIRELWPGDLVLKGVLRADDARRAAAEGAGAVIVSNHGGRQLDGAPATLPALQDVVAAVGDQLEVLLDGGVQRGGDVVKALSLGARAVLIGRASLWGLAIGGERGVLQTLELLRAGIDRTMGLLGCAQIADLSPDLVSPGASGGPSASGPRDRR
jgi:isopentenyl diphosphate isomerase/L-lactate dehydrogenase-like FMN-dependent dehydrogenase